MIVLVPRATPDQNRVYNRGRNAALSGYRSLPPVNLTWQGKHWWLAGFHDVELERKYRKEQEK